MVDGKEVDTFDFVDIQLYETYNRAFINITLDKQSASSFMINQVNMISEGWMVDFSSVPELEYNSTIVRVPKEKLLIGLANSWADPKKVQIIEPSSC